MIIFFTIEFSIILNIKNHLLEYIYGFKEKHILLNSSLFIVKASGGLSNNQGNNFSEIYQSTFEENNINLLNKSRLNSFPNLDTFKKSSPMFYSLNDQLSNLELIIKDFLNLDLIIL